MKAARRSSYVILPVLALGFLSVVAATRPVTVTKREVAANWAKAHAGNLPTDYAGVASYAAAYRKEIMHTLPLDAQKKLWRQHLAVFLQPVSQLSPLQLAVRHQLAADPTARQRAVIQAVSDSLERFFSIATSDQERREFSTKLCAQVSGVFDPLSKGIILSTIGLREDPPVEAKRGPSEASLISGYLFAIRSLATKVGLVAPVRADCSCSGGSGCDCTAIGIFCSQTYPACSGSNWGCGCLGWGACEGVCQLAS